MKKQLKTKIMTILYNELGEDLKDPYSISETETLVILFSNDLESEEFAEVYISRNSVDILDFKGNKKQYKAVLEYAKIAKQSINDYINYF